MAAELAIPHRLRRGPFQQSELTLQDLQSRIEQVQASVNASDEVEVVPGDEQPEDKKKVVGPSR